jgi:hypothetical protein
MSYYDFLTLRFQHLKLGARFGTIKRMSGGGRFLTRGLRAVKAEAALSVLAFNILHTVNAFGASAVIPN